MSKDAAPRTEEPFVPVEPFPHYERYDKIACYERGFKDGHTKGYTAKDAEIERLEASLKQAEHDARLMAYMLKPMNDDGDLPLNLSAAVLRYL